jgi:hypothetical protein
MARCGAVVVVLYEHAPLIFYVGVAFPSAPLTATWMVDSFGHCGCGLPAS